MARLVGSVSSAREGGRTATFSSDNPQGGVATFGQVILDDVQRRVLKPQQAAKRFVRVLAGPRSFWPAPSGTRNRGPQSTGESVRAFAAVQGRSGSGRFQPFMIINRARSARDGRPYAGLVDRGIYNWNARESRRRANLAAVRRTWNAYIGQQDFE